MHLTHGSRHIELRNVIPRASHDTDARINEVGEEAFCEVEAAVGATRALMKGNAQ